MENVKTIQELKDEKFPELIYEKDFKNNVFQLSSKGKEQLYTVFIRECKLEQQGTLLLKILNNRILIENIINNYISHISNLQKFDYNNIISELNYDFGELDDIGNNFQYLLEQPFKNLAFEFYNSIESINNSIKIYNPQIADKNDDNDRIHLENFITKNRLKLENYNINNFVKENKKIQSTINEVIDSVDIYILDGIKKKDNINYILTIPRAKYVKKGNETIMDFELKDFYDLINAYIYYFYNNSVCLRKCKNCGKYFFKNGKQKFCDNIFKNGRTCRETVDDSRNKDNNDPQTLFRKNYQRQIQRRDNLKESNSHITDYFELWNGKAIEMRDKCRKGLITIDELNKWFNDNDKDWIKGEVN